MKRSKLIALAVVLAVMTQGAMALDQCEADASQLGARYELLEFESADATDPQRQLLSIWRKGRQLAHERDRPAITEVWAHVAPGRYQLTRYFDEFQRGIEYQSGEIGTDEASVAWSQKWVLVPAERRAELEHVASEGEGCRLVEIYTRTEGETSTRLEWLPKLQLPRDYTVQSPAGKTRLRLLETITEPDAVAAAFSVRSAWPTLDYADIGDSEQDPFLRDMIRLGYIEHADQQGGGHSH